MAVTSIVSSVGARYGVVFKLDENGLPYQAVSSATPETGIRISGLKTATAQPAEPQEFTHYGDDNAFAKDSLSATEIDGFSLTTAKTNYELDAYISGTKVRTYNTELNAIVKSSDNVGNEPRVCAFFYRQSLDTDPGSATFGTLREYEWRFYPSARLIDLAPSFEQGMTDKTYRGIPTRVSFTPWGENINTTNWGADQGVYIEGVAQYHPRTNVYRGDGTLTEFELSHTPVSSAFLKVWVDGTATTPSTVSTSATNPSFTLGAAPADGDLVFAFIQTLTPTQAAN